MKEEIKELINRALKEIESSKILLENKHYSPSISRSYYAMFYSAEALLLTKNLKFSSHKGVISSFSLYFVKSRVFPKEMSKNFVKIFEERLDADYEFIETATEERAREALRASEDFVKKIITYLKEQGYQF